MKLIRTLAVSEQEFYDYLEQDLISSIEAQKNQTISAKEIKKGLSFRKHDEKSNAPTKITILGYERGRFYSLRLHTMVDTIELHYHTEQTDKGLKVTFEQFIDSFERRKHKKLMRMFSEGVYFGRMSDTLYDMQNKIIKQRGEKVMEPK